MLGLPRRAVLAGSSAMLATAASTFGAADAQQPKPQYDLVIRGGEVIDPSQALRGRRDVAIHNAVVAAVESDIPREAAAQTINADGSFAPGWSTFTRMSFRKCHP